MGYLVDGEAKPDPLATTPVLPAAEVMVWPWRQQRWPMTLEGSNSKACSLKPADQIGAKPIVVGATLWQRSWDVYLGCASSGDTVWPVLSFVPQQPLVNDAGVVVANGQLGDFLAYASSNLRSWTQWDPSWWVAGVEFGSEIIEGKRFVDHRAISNRAMTLTSSRQALSVDDRDRALRSLPTLVGADWRRPATHRLPRASCIGRIASTHSTMRWRSCRRLHRSSTA